MTGLGYWKQDYALLTTEEEYEEQINNNNTEDDLAFEVLYLEEEITKLYYDIKSKQQELCVNVFDNITLLSLRDWLSKYIVNAKYCFVN